MNTSMLRNSSFFYLFLFLLAQARVGISQLLIQPEQIHIAYGAKPSEMTVTWVTFTKTDSLVEYGTSYLINVTKGTGPTKFVDGGFLRRQLWIHKVTLKNLSPGTKYLYHVGSGQGWSDLYYFRAMQSGSSWSPSFAVFGDMGNKNAIAMGSLQQAAQRADIDAILHVGDFAYDLDKYNARVGDAFMNQIQSVGAYIPYMVCAGNHENAYNFSNYKARFAMPGGDGQNLFYSFDIGPAHIIAVSTEVYYFFDYEKYGGILTAINQYKWLEDDLKKANKPKNRRAHPWIIVVGHRPMYCSNHDTPKEHCNNLHNNTVRTGFPGLPFLGLEHIFYKYGVDLQFSGHEHSYERLWPIFNLTVCNGTQSPYTNPRAPVHIITGSGGNEEGQVPFNKVVYPWSAYHTEDYGYTKMTIINGTHLQLQQISTYEDKPDRVVDRITIIKDRHGAGMYDCHKHT